MPYILDFTNPYQLTSEIPPQRYNLRLILWAGDGEHDGVTDVRRLNNYDVYVCLGLQSDVLKRNIDDLVGMQTLCIIDMRNHNQLIMFHEMFRESFSKIDADYFGNTPTLPLAVYAPLLGIDGIAYNTEGLNGLIMSQENFLNILEIFAPVLKEPTREMRRWDKMILDLAKRDDISPGEVWSSPDLKDKWYNHHRQKQQHFQGWQKERNSAWPWFKPTIEEHCEDLKPYTLCARIHETSMPPEIMQEIEPHLPAFHNYLAEKVEALSAANPQIVFRRVDGVRDLDFELEGCSNIYKRVRIYQNALKCVSDPIPEGLVGEFGHYVDSRHAEKPIMFGFYYRRV